MMIEIIPRPVQKLPLWQNILFYFSLSLILAVFLSYFILDNYIKNASQDLKDLEGTISQEKTSAETTLEKEVFGYQKKITDFSQLIKTHFFTSNVFTFLEKASHPQVWFVQFNLDSEKKRAVLAGQADNFQALGQQLLILKEKPEIQNFDLSNISIGKKGKVDFALELSLNSVVFSR